jgi:hypothetical protein
MTKAAAFKPPHREPVVGANRREKRPFHFLSCWRKPRGRALYSAFERSALFGVGNLGGNAEYFRPIQECMRTEVFYVYCLG